MHPLYHFCSFFVSFFSFSLYLSPLSPSRFFFFSLSLSLSSSFSLFPSISLNLFFLFLSIFISLSLSFPSLYSTLSTCEPLRRDMTRLGSSTNGDNEV